MRLISFALTTRQFLDGSKSVTRRLGWELLTPGSRLMAVEKAQGIPKGGKMRRLGEIQVLAVTRERLDIITHEECVLEGFPEVTPAQFVEMFCASMTCSPSDTVTRIQFRRV